MLAYVLALAVGLGSLAIYLAAFFFPEVHRKNDFIWSGVGLFYALVLWVCAGRISGSLLLGQVAGVALLGWSVGQTLSLRRQLTPRSSQTELPSTEEVKNTVQEKVSNFSLFNRISQIGKGVGGSATAAKDRLQQNLSGATPAPSPAPTAAPDATGGSASSATINTPTSPTAEDNSRVQIIDNRTPISQPANVSATEQVTTNTASIAESVPEVIQANPPQPDELVQAARESTAAEDAQAGEASPSPTDELVLETDAEIEPALTEEEAIALAVETTLAEADQADQEGVVTEPMRPHPPDPEIVEAAIRDAEEKHIEASPPEPETPENPSPS